MYISKPVLVALGFALLLGVFFGLMIASNFHTPSATHPISTQAAEPVILGGRTALPPGGANDSWSSGKAFVDVAKRVIPTVVSITSQKVVRSSRFSLPDFFHPWWRRDRDPEGDEPRGRRQQGLGSGVIISEEGYIVTNYHVVKGADEIYVLNDQDRFDAEVVGTDPETDLAVIKIKDTSAKFQAISLGNSDELEVGEWVLAIGSPFSIWLQHSVTAGIVSGKGRINVGLGEIVYQDFIQTDAAINPGNSGGALVNLRGELVGINTAIYSDGFSGGNVGIGFAIPVNLVKYVAKELIENGKVRRGWLGVVIEPLDKTRARELRLDTTEGALVSDLDDGPARSAGIRINDVIVEFAGVRIKDSNHLLHVVATHKPGEVVQVKVLRRGKVKHFLVELWERPQRVSLSQRIRERSFDLGFEVKTLTPELALRFDIAEDEGVVVMKIKEDSEAAKEGLDIGDLIISVNKNKVRTEMEFWHQIMQAREKNVILLHVSRSGNRFFVALNLDN